MASTSPSNKPINSACPVVRRTCCHCPAPLSLPTSAEAPVPKAAITIALANCTIVAIPTAVSATAPNRPTIAVVTTPVIITPDISSTTGQARDITCQRITFLNEFRMNSLSRRRPE